jgi:hypothetical protein
MTGSIRLFELEDPFDLTAAEILCLPEKTENPQPALVGDCLQFPDDVTADGITCMRSVSALHNPRDLLLLSGIPAASRYRGKVPAG